MRLAGYWPAGCIGQFFFSILQQVLPLLPDIGHLAGFAAAHPITANRLKTIAEETSRCFMAPIIPQDCPPVKPLPRSFGKEKAIGTADSADDADNKALSQLLYLRSLRKLLLSLCRFKAFRLGKLPRQG